MKTHLDVLGELLVDEVGEVTSIIEDHVEGLAVREDDGLFDTPHILLVSLTLPSVDGDTAGGDSSSCVILGGEDVAGAPCDIGSKLEQSFDEDSGLDGHVKTPGDPCTSQRLLGPVDATEVHQTGHFILSEGQLLAAPVSKGDVSYNEEFCYKSY